MKLTQQQQTIMKQSSGNHLVIAGAGCGLTETFLHIAHYYQNQGQSKRIAFLDCNYSTQHTKLRLNSLLGNRTKVTIHSVDVFAKNLLQQLQHQQGKKVTTDIITSDVERGIVQAIAKEQGFKNPTYLWKAYKGKMLPQDSTRNQITKITTAYKAYKTSNNVLDYDDVYQFFLKHPKQLQAAVANLHCVLIDNLQSVTQRQALFIERLSRHVPLLIMGGDPAQCTHAVGQQYSISWQYLTQRLTYQEHALTQSHRIGKCLSLFSNAVASHMGYVKVKPRQTSHDHKPIYQSFIDSDSQNQYLQEKIALLLKAGINPNEIAIVCRTKLYLLHAKHFLNANGIPTVDSFINFYDYKKAYEVILCLCRITYFLTQKEPVIHEHDLYRLIEFIGVEQHDHTSLVNKVVKHGITALKISRANDNRKVSDCLASIRKAIQQATCSKPEAGIQMLVDAIKISFGYQFNNHNIITSCVTRIKLLVRDCIDWKQALDTLNVPSKVEQGIHLSTFHKALGGQWQYVFLINIVDGHTPYTKYSNSKESIDTESRLFYSMVTRADNQLFILRTPTQNHSFKDKQANDKQLVHTHNTKESSLVIDHKKSFKTSIPNELHIEELYTKHY